MKYPQKLSDWINKITTSHPKSIDLGLDRIKKVALLLNLTIPPCTTITVGGTNGKGSCVAFLENIYLRAGYKTGTFISPTLLDFTEHVRINGENCVEENYCAAFTEISEAANKAQTSLSLFEYTTLAALIMFYRVKLDVIILEIGMGGRDDAVNVVESDLALIATIAIEHTQWLGNTREEIGLIKADLSALTNLLSVVIIVRQKI